MVGCEVGVLLKGCVCVVVVDVFIVGIEVL